MSDDSIKIQKIKTDIPESKATSTEHTEKTKDIDIYGNASYATETDALQNSLSGKSTDEIFIEFNNARTEIRNIEIAKSLQDAVQEYYATGGRSSSVTANTRTSDAMGKMQFSSDITPDKLQEVLDTITSEDKKAIRENSASANVANYIEESVHGKDKLEKSAGEAVKSKKAKLNKVSQRYKNAVDNEGIISSAMNKAFELLKITSRKDVENAINNEDKNIAELQKLAESKDIKAFMQRYKEITGAEFKIENFEKLEKTEQKYYEAINADKMQKISQKLRRENSNFGSKDNYNLDSFENYLRSATPKYSPLEKALYDTFKDPSLEYGDPNAKKMCLEWIKQKTQELGLEKATPEKKYKELVKQFLSDSDKISGAILGNKNLEYYETEYKKSLTNAYGKNIPEEKLNDYLSNQDNAKMAAQVTVMIGAGMLSGGSAFAAALATGTFSVIEKGSDKNGLSGEDMVSTGVEMAFTYGGFKVFTLASSKVTPTVKQYLLSKGITEATSAEIAGYTGSVTGGAVAGGSETFISEVAKGEAITSAAKKAGKGMLTGAGAAVVFHGGARTLTKKSGKVKPAQTEKAKTEVRKNETPKREFQKSEQIKVPVNSDTKVTQSRLTAQKMLEDIGLYAEKENILVNGNEVTVSGLNNGLAKARIITNPDGSKVMFIEGEYIERFMLTKEGRKKITNPFTDEYKYAADGSKTSARIYDPTDKSTMYVTYYKNGGQKTFRRTNADGIDVVNRTYHTDGAVDKDILKNKVYKHSTEPYQKPDSASEPKTTVLSKDTKIKHPLNNMEITLKKGSKITKSPDGKILSFESEMFGCKSKSSYDYYSDGTVKRVQTDITGDKGTYTEISEYHINGNLKSQTANDAKTWRINGQEHPIQYPNSKVVYDRNGKAIRIEYKPKNLNGGTEIIQIRHEKIKIPQYREIEISENSQLTYNKSGQLEFIKQPNGAKFYFEYDASGKPSYIEHNYSKGGRAETEFANGVKISRVQYTADGKMDNRTIFQPNGQIKCREFFDENQVCRTEEFYDESGKLKTTINYDKNGKEIIHAKKQSMPQEKAEVKAVKEKTVKPKEKAEAKTPEEPVFDEGFLGESDSTFSELSSRYEAIRHTDRPYPISETEIKKLETYSNKKMVGFKYGGSWNRRMSIKDAGKLGKDMYHVSLNVEPNVELIKKLDSICLKHGDKMHYKFALAYETEETVSTWSRKLDPITVYLGENSEAIIAEIQAAAKPYIRGGFGPKAVGKEISEGICVSIEPSKEACLELVERAKKVDYNLAEAIEDYARKTDGQLSAGQYTIAEKMLSERIAKKSGNP